MVKLLVKIGVVILVLISIYFTLMRINMIPDFLGLNNLVKKDELRIEPSALIIENVKNIAQLFTSNYYTEFLLTEAKSTEALFGITRSKHELILIAKGTCFAGTDLSKLSVNDMQIKDPTTCMVNLPRAEILDIVMNPSDFDIYSEIGSWTPEEITKAKIASKEKLRQKAIESDILDKANNRSKQIFTDFLLSIGYKNITVNLKSEAE